MFVKLGLLLCLLGVAIAAYNGPLAEGLPAAQFPAGIDPQSCPNYPNCESPLVALSQAALPQQRSQSPYNTAPQYNTAPAQQYNAAPAQQYNAAPAQQYNAAPQYNALPQYNPAPQQYLAPAPAQAPAPQYYNQQPQFAQPQPQPQPQYNTVPQQPQYSPEIQNALNRGQYIGDGDYHGEGLVESGAPGAQPQNAVPAYNQQPQYPGQRS